MKTNLKLNSTLSFKAIEAKARKAAAFAALKHAAECNQPVKTRTKKISDIEREIRSIFRALTSTASEDKVVSIETPVKGASCRAIIRIFKTEDINRQSEEEKFYHEQLSQGMNRNELDKPYKANPIVMYALYPQAYDSTKLGSIAIYGDDASMRQTLILRQGSLFGHTVVRANLEMGRRLFVNVKLAS